MTTKTFPEILTLTAANELGARILTESGFERGVRGYDVATWSHADGRFGRLSFESDFSQGPQSAMNRIVSIALRSPRVGSGPLPAPITLAELAQ